MAEVEKSVLCKERIIKEAPQLVAVLKEMKEGLDMLRNKIQALTVKVKADNFPTSDGISYLEAKHLLLLNYCQSLVYYLLRKAKGSSIQGHPVVRSLIEIRLFLEKIRPIDKKLQYQIQKLTKTPAATLEKPGSVEEADGAQKKEDLLKYRPNPELLVSKINATENDDSGVYRPPKIAPASMEEGKMSRQERNALRKEKETLRQANESVYVRELMNEMEGRPEEVRETLGTESREMTRYISKMDERARQEEELFSRVPFTKFEKKKMKRLEKNSRNGLHGLNESFYDEIKALPVEGSIREQSISFDSPSNGERKFKKHKRKR